MLVKGNLSGFASVSGYRVYQALAAENLRTCGCGRQSLPNLEMEDGADRYAGAIRRASRIADADIVELRAYRQVGQNCNINAAADAIGEVGGGAAPVAQGEMRGTRQELGKRSDFGWVVQDDSRTEEKRVCIG